MFKSTVIALILCLSATTSMAQVQCQALCVTLSKEVSPLTGLYHLQSADEVTAATAPDLVAKCQGETSLSKKALLKDLKTVRIATGRVDSQPLYIESYTEASEANSCSEVKAQSLLPIQ